MSIAFKALPGVNWVCRFAYSDHLGYSNVKCSYLDCFKSYKLKFGIAVFLPPNIYRAKFQTLANYPHICFGEIF